jgi:Fic family protein
MTVFESTGLMEPMLPLEGNPRLENLAVDLVAKASGLASQLPLVVRHSVGDLVRSMNCYYSNLIEGHDTHPGDIDRALGKDYSSNPKKRMLQLEAIAHIEVQRLIDHGKDIKADVTSIEYIKWLHDEFCKRLPEELLWIENPDTGNLIHVDPGELRTGFVAVGRHIPPGSEFLPDFLTRFQDAYATHKLSRVRQVISLGASHHRLLWIHPFYDGNGRVTRLMSHAALRRYGVGNSLWSVARGLARNVQKYKELLEAADEPRRGDLDGRGTLSEQALVNFCEFFLMTCIDQIEFMASLLEPTELLRRIQIYLEEEVRGNRLPKGSFPLLRETLMAGEVPRGRAAELTGYGERMARTVVSELLKKGLLKSASARGPLTLGFPIDVVERWFPLLYPATIR